MKSHKLDIKGNALDSLNEGLRRFAEAREGDVRAYKFAVLHVSHFLELLLKHAVAEQHSLLVYTNPASRSLAKEKTISMWDAINILRNAGVEVDKALVDDVEWLKALRNQIEHFAFEMDVKATRNTLGRIIRSTDQFASANELGDLSSEVDEDCADLYEELKDEYQSQLANAQADAEADAEEGDGEVTDRCNICGEPKVAVRNGRKIYCHFCEDEEAVHECVICGEYYPEGEMSVWNDERETTDYACEYCEARIFGD
jgi:regulator of protease activity HflC (stomatin/prohibitin superfamily)/DNA-directed RNA polymerase subunit RPC12/RpoP